MIRSRRMTLLVIVGVAVVALVAGLGAGQFIRSPADAASRVSAPEASAIAVPVELRLLETQVVTRGDAGFAGATEVELDLGELPTAPVVTGQVPERGDELEEGEPLLEVVGRPVIALAGELPMYRSLRPGMTGPDVVQLKETLRRLGLNPGGDNDRYEFATGQAVAELFRRAGYAAPEPDGDAVAELDVAREVVEAAEDELAAAEAALKLAEDPGDDEPGAAGELNEAKKQVERAKKALDEARTALSEAQFEAGTPLPSSEAHYLPDLPRRVDDVNVSRGDLADGTVMSVSGADLQITAQVSDADREVLAEDMTAILDIPGGDATGTVTDIRAAEGEGARGYEVVIVPEELTPEQVDEVRSRNIRVTIPVSSTDGEVLAVPLAALTAGGGAEARVEVRRDAETTELVEVTVGLVAQGYAEVTAVDGSLAEGDLVVVGESGIANGEAEDE